MREGTRFKFRNLLFWADRGLICIEDDRDASYDVVVVREFLLRAKAINDEIKRMIYPSDRLEHQEFVEHAIVACKQAQQQGRPDDPKAVADMLKARRKKILDTGGKGMTRHGEASGASISPEGKLIPPLLFNGGQILH